MTPTLRFLQLDVRWCHLLRTLGGKKTGSSSNTFRLENPVRHPSGDVKLVPGRMDLPLLRPMSFTPSPMLYDVDRVSSVPSPLAISVHESG